MCGSRSGEGATLRFAVRLLSKMGPHIYTRLTDSVNARVMVPSVSVGAWLKGRIQSEMRKCTTAQPASSKERHRLHWQTERVSGQACQAGGALTRVHHCPFPPRVCAPCPLVNVRCSESWPFGRLDGLRKGPLDLSLHTTLRIHFTEHVIRVSIMLARRARSRWMRVDEVPSPASSSPVARSIQRCVGPPPHPLANRSKHSHGV